MYGLISIVLKRIYNNTNNNNNAQSYPRSKQLIPCGQAEDYYYFWGDSYVMCETVIWI